MHIYINSIKLNNSLVDGPGIRTVVFLQGCEIKCKGCHNYSTWDIEKGKKVKVRDVFDEIHNKMFNKKITISGGEPLLQKEALLELLKLLNKHNYDIALYTGYLKEDVPKEIIKKIKYLKYGPFKIDLATSTMPYIGSTNQVFERIDKNETIKK